MQGELPDTLGATKPAFQGMDVQGMYGYMHKPGFPERGRVPGQVPTYLDTCTMPS